MLKVQMSKKQTKGILVLFLALAIPLGLMKACSVAMFGDCGYKDQLPPYQALSQDRLEKLYWQMRKIFADETESFLTMEKAHEKYPKITDLKFKAINIDENWVVIGGCFDDKAILSFGGIILTDEAPSITLAYGEGPHRKVEILWQGVANAPNK